MRVHQISIALIVASAAGFATADVIDDPSLITLRHDFESDPPSAPPPGPFTLGNATFSEASSGTGGPGWRLLDGFFNGTRILTDNAGITDMTISFDTPMVRAGLLVGIGPGTYDVHFLDASGGIVGTVTGTVPSTTDSFFAGWEHGGGIVAIHVLEPSGENGLVGGIDDVRYDYVPAPGAMALLGLAGLTGLRRRRSA